MPSLTVGKPAVMPVMSAARFSCFARASGAKGQKL